MRASHSRFVIITKKKRKSKHFFWLFCLFLRSSVSLFRLLVKLLFLGASSDSYHNILTHVEWAYSCRSQHQAEMFHVKHFASPIFFLRSVLMICAAPLSSEAGQRRFLFCINSVSFRRKVMPAPEYFPLPLFLVSFSRCATGRPAPHQQPETQASESSTCQPAPWEAAYLQSEGK